jgi:hypothetical protein
MKFAFKGMIESKLREYSLLEHDVPRRKRTGKGDEDL